MESDDDYQSFSPPQQPSPPVQLRKLKRLKKSSSSPENPPPARSVDNLISLPPVDFAKLEALESSQTLGHEDSDEPLSGNDLISLPPVDFAKLEALESSQTLGRKDSNDSPSQSQSLSPEGVDDENELYSQSPSRSESPPPEGVFDEGRKETKRALAFNDDEFDRDKVEQTGEEQDLIASLKTNKYKKKRSSKGSSNEKKEQAAASLKTKKSEKKRTSEASGNEKKEKKKKVDEGVNKRREEKERKAYLQQLHADSQRLLRETRDAAFKLVPVIQKPISSVLEKIRQRKLELSKKISLTSSTFSNAESNLSSRDAMMDQDSEDFSVEERGASKSGKQVEEETVACNDHVDNGLNTSNVAEPKQSGLHTTCENAPSQMALDEESTPAFRAPVDDTQDLFGDSQTGDSEGELPDGQQNSPLEEVMAPSLLAMNLKFDSAPPDDMSSDEEDNDKENIDPYPHQVDTTVSSPKGDPVKGFIDDEAVEEDDSDNDLFRFQENEEDEDNEDLEDLSDMIATNYKEKPIDNDRRNELHQKWLEQQDATGTDNLLQKLKYGPRLREAGLLDDDEEDYEDEEEFSNETEDVIPSKLARINSRNTKQMISQMFSDKDDAYLSSDDEEREERLVKQCLLDKVEDQATMLSPAEDESSRDIFGLIKKLNIAPDTKKKPKASSFFEMPVTGGNSNSSKPSFRGRGSNHSLPSVRNQRSSMVKSFIFGRDDSNSRSSMSMSEESSDTVSSENGPTRRVTTKFSSSQAKFSSQTTKISAETASGTSLFEILKRSSLQSDKFGNQESMVGLTQFAALKMPKTLIKMGARI